MRLNVRLTILELLEQGRDHGLISFEYEGMRLNVRLNFWNSCNNIELDVSIVC